MRERERQTYPLLHTTDPPGPLDEELLLVAGKLKSRLHSLSENDVSGKRVLREEIGTIRLLSSKRTPLPPDLLMNVCLLDSFFLADPLPRFFFS